MKISVLICTRNRPQDIVWCLPTVLANEYRDFEVVLVDQSDGTETAEIIAPYLKSHSNFVYIPTETRGHDKALNLGTRACTGEVVACTDDDCQTVNDWVTKVAELFTADPQLDMVFGQVHRPDELPKEDVVVPSLYFGSGRQLRRGDIMGMGANMIFRRSLYFKVNGFDEMLGPGAPLACSGDFDFLYRAQCLGAKATLEPSLVLVHRAHRSREQWDRVMYLYGLGDAAFYLKHARCGDLWAIRRLMGKLIYSVARCILGKPLGKGRSQDKYLLGLWQGMSKSWQYEIDHTHRMYREVSQTGAHAHA